jgi:hypothetical protein
LIAPNGDFKPTTNGERLAQAALCTNQKRDRASASLDADVFDWAQVANDLKAGHGNNTACQFAARGLGDGTRRLRMRQTICR